MLSAAIHYATLNSFRSIKLPISLYKPPALMLALPDSLSGGNTVAGYATQGAVENLFSDCQKNCRGFRNA